MENAKSIGTILMEARLVKKLSLADVENATSIRARYLEAVEHDEYDKTPGGVFLKGIIRNYGDYLGLNGLELVDLYKQTVVGKTSEKLGIREVEKVKLNIQLKEKRDIGSGTGKFEMPQLPIKQILMGTAAVVILAIGYFAVPAAINYFSSNNDSVSSENIQLKTESKQDAPVTTAITDKVQVEMEAVGDDCWLEVSADGKEIFAGIIAAKSKRTFEAEDKLVVKYGNIGVMKLVVNGNPVDLHGEHGVAVKTYIKGDNGSVQQNVQTENSKPATEPTPVVEEVPQVQEKIKEPQQNVEEVTEKKVKSEGKESKKQVTDKENKSKGKVESKAGDI